MNQATRKALRRLAAHISELASTIEDTRCTCPDTDTRNRLHTAPGRRRKDSACHGVAAAVAAELRARRLLMQLRRALRK